MDKLVSPRKTAEVLQKYDIKPNKKYGQNFLIDENVLSKILQVCDLSPQDHVLEIGPGIGTLTQVLCPRAKMVTAVEVDRRLISILQETLEDCRNLQLIQGDILKMDLQELLSQVSKERKCKVISNLPYNITTPLIMKLLEVRDPIETMVFMVQREAAQRITAGPGGKDYGAVSVLVQFYSKAETVFNISPRVFIPPPEVESSLIKITIRERLLYSVRDEKLLAEVVRGSFQHRRKSILNSLSASLKMNKGKLSELIKEAGIEPSCRAESLSPAEFANLTNFLYNIIGDNNRTKI